MEAFQRGDWARAAQLAEEALAIDAGSYDAAQVRVLATLNAGRAGDALGLAEALIARFPDDAFAHNSLGAVLQVLGRLEEAAGAYRKAVAMAPQNALARTNLAQACAGLGRHDEAAQVLREAIALDPRSAVAREGLASVLLASGQPAEAERVARETHSLGLATPSTFVHLAAANLQMDRPDAALAPAREAVRGAPQWPAAVELAARAELDVGSVAAALERYASLETLAPPPDRWRFLRALAWPAIAESREQIAQRLEEVDRALDDLVARPARLADPYREVGMSGFYIGYQGFDDTQLQRKIARAYSLAAPDLEWSAPHVARKRERAGRIRLGILSSFLNNHTIGKLNIGLARKIDPKRFELVVIRPPCAPDFLSASFDECAERVVTLPRVLGEARRTVAQAELDALFYPDIGMDPFTYFLAFARLARVQFTTWGHPVTTGIPNIDYFLSTRHAEPADAQRYYGEKLVAFDHPPSYYYRPREPSAFDVRAHLGLAPDERLYASLQTLYKIHPDFDRALVRILRGDPRGRVLLIAARHEGWNGRLRRRIEREGPDVAGRIVFMPPVPLPDYLAVLRDVDALLDTFHFGGGNSSYESFGMSSPVVTLPGERMRARITAALYARMGQSRWIASSADHFAALALELARDRASRAQWRREIGEGADRFLENDAVLGELEDFIEAALA